jgi:asparagine synthase (glutamine-hydrolysing)
MNDDILNSFLRDYTYSMQITMFWYNLGPTLHILCGIAGIWLSGQHGEPEIEGIKRAIKAMQRRGPDARAYVAYPQAVLGHVRLSIIDTSSRSHQPMTDPTGRYTLVFNGEVYNYKDLAVYLQNTYSVEFSTSGDTEVLLYGLIHEGAGFLPKINGFFAFGFYDLRQHSLLAARDRFGIKPFFYSSTHDKLVIGSTLGAIMELVNNREIDFQSLATYLQLSYIPAPSTMLKGVNKLLPGHLIACDAEGVNVEKWYGFPHAANSKTEARAAVTSFGAALDESVRKRLVTDVPLGTFLSGGLDSSVITLLANRHQPGLPAFTIGFPDQPYFDETSHAKAVASHIGAKHHVVPVHSKELDERIYHVLDSFDEPFADSSAILVNILSEYTRGEVKVALSGDGADELLGGYNKHKALLRSLNKDFVNTALLGVGTAMNILPESRQHGVFDRLRKLKRYSRGIKLEFAERYFLWACFTPESAVSELTIPGKLDYSRHEAVISLLTNLDAGDFNSVLATDFQLVLPNDMLYKVDSMSMDHGLEVRVPFLDHNLVELVFGFPANAKLNASGGKLLLKKAFSDDFPPGTFDHKKRGFEAPLGHWLNTFLTPQLDICLNSDFISRQGIFRIDAIHNLRLKVKSKNPGDSPYTLWAILVFQHWYKKYIDGRQ